MSALWILNVIGQTHDFKARSKIDHVQFRVFYDQVTQCVVTMELNPFHRHVGISSIFGEKDQTISLFLIHQTTELKCVSITN